MKSPPYTYPTAYWHVPAPSLPQADYGICAAASPSAIYLVGGKDAGLTTPLQRLKLNADLQPAESGWETLSGIPAMQAFASCALVNDILYIFGGVDEGGAPLPTITAYDVVAGRTIQCKQMPEALLYVGCAVDGTKIHLTGGVNTDGVSAQYWIFDTAGQILTRGSDLPAPNRSHLSFVERGALYVLGGSGQDCMIELGGGQSWMQLAQFPGRSLFSGPDAVYPAAAQVAHYGMFYSGAVGTAAAQAWAFDTYAATWTSAPDSAPHAASNGAATSIQLPGGVAVYLIGGKTDGSAPTDGCELIGYDPTAAHGRLHPLRSMAGTCAEARSGLGAIYGSDDRIEIADIGDAARRQLAYGVGGLVETSDLIASGSDWTIAPGHSLASAIQTLYEGPLAPDQKFGDERAFLAFGTCFRVGTRWIATAGHSICQEPTDTLLPFDSYRIVFNWATNAEGNVPTSLAGASVYTPVAIKRWTYQLPGSNTTTDWAIVEVDRDIDASIPILPLASAAPAVGDPVWAVGHGMGLPAKYSTGTVKDNSAARTFELTIDAFQGGSGSPILNASNQVVGIISRGPAPEWAKDDDGEVRATVFEPSDSEYWLVGQRIGDIAAQLGPISALQISITIGSSFFAGTSDSLGGAINRGLRDFGWTNPPFFPNGTYTIAYTTDIATVAEVNRVEVAKTLHFGWGWDDALIDTLRLVVNGSTWMAFNPDQWVGSGAGSDLDIAVPARWAPPA